MRLKDATILIVDDEVDLRSIFRTWFEREGCRIVTAEDGEQALEMSKTNPLDMVISDVRMPKMDGLEMAKRLQQLGKRLPKIVFISGFSELDERDCCDLGIENILSKPIRRDILVAAATSCLTDRYTLWQQASEIAPQNSLDIVFDCLSGALEQGLIAFGRGGLCIHTALDTFRGQTMGLSIAFTSDRRALVGQGIVRWTARSEERIGIEITYINDQTRTWVVGLTEGGGSLSFIPRSRQIP